MGKYVYSVKWDIILWLWEMGHYPLGHRTFTHRHCEMGKYPLWNGHNSLRVGSLNSENCDNILWEMRHYHLGNWTFIFWEMEHIIHWKIVIWEMLCVLYLWNVEGRSCLSLNHWIEGAGSPPLHVKLHSTFEVYLQPDQINMAVFFWYIVVLWWLMYTEQVTFDKVPERQGHV